MSHGTYGQEVAFMPLIHLGTVFEQFAADHSRGRNNHVPFANRRGNGLNGFLP